MTSGIYVLAGGGFNVSGNASVTGSYVMIYNAGTGYNNVTGADGGSFRRCINLSGNASFLVRRLQTHRIAPRRSHDLPGGR